MAEGRVKSLRAPDQNITFPGIAVAQIELGDLTVGRIVQQPGWRWSTHVRPHVGGEWCQARHVGFVVSGHFGVLFSDGTTMEFGPDDVHEIPPGHDGYTIGDEPCVVIEWAGLRAFSGFPVGSRALASILFTDIVDSTSHAQRVGDGAWRDLLSVHFETARGELERFRGREVKTTGDGLLATFDGPAQALRCAAAIRDLARTQGLQIRAGVHVGEVELVGSDVRGVAVHEAARIMAAAADDEILLSEITRALALTAGLEFEDRGIRTLKGLEGEWRLYAYCADAPSG
jgi:class 3 adenylate cyclase